MYKRNDGVVVVAVAVLGLGLVVGGFAWDFMTASTRRSNAEDQARAYAQEMYPNENPIHVICQGQDTDNNGYVSCSLRVQQRPIIPVECAAYVVFSLNRGCRPTRLVMQTGQ